MKIMTFTQWTKWRSISLFLSLLFLWQLPHSEAADNMPSEKMQLEEAFLHIGKEYSVFFNYDREIIANVTVEYESGKYADVESALKSVFSQTHLQYQIFDQRFVAVYQDTREGIQSMKEMISHFQGIVDEKESHALDRVAAVAPLSNRSLKDIHQKRITFSVSGTVTNEEGEPLIGVNIQVKGSNQGTSSDFDGKFTLEDIDENAVLVVSYIGYQTQEIEVSGRSELTLTLVSDAQLLDEIVVVGYGSMKKRHLTGSVGSLQMDETLESRPVVDFGQAMYGKISGVQVLNSSGRPGESSRIQIRGVNSISANSTPLIVIDGVIMPGYDLNTINSNDIESIEILKDAASSAIYGSRGANGVILVTTKSGKPGKPSLTFNYSYSNQNILKKVDVMNGPEYAQAAIDAAQNGWVDRGGDPNAPNTIEARGEYKYMWPKSLENPKDLPNTDWQDIAFRSAPMHQADIGYSGGDENTKFYLSASVVNQEGIVIKSDYEKYTLNIKADSEINKWLNVGGMINLTYDSESIPDSYTLTGATQYPSIYSVYADDGLLGGPSTIDDFRNWDGILFRAYHGHPYQGIYEDDLRERFNTAANLFTEIEIFPSIKYRGSFNAFYGRNDNTEYSPIDRNLGIDYRALYKSIMGRTQYYTLENLLIYNKDLNNHQVDAVVGYEFNQRKGYSLAGERRDYDNDLVRYLSSGSTIQNASDDASEYALLSILGRINYNYNGKYMASATFRRDGSSRFGPMKKWGNFPSISAGWRISEEKFIADNISWASNLKLRVSYGLTGNDNFGNYRWVSTMSQGKAAFGNNLVTTYYPSRIENPDLAWERTKVYNLGLDLGFFNNRISLETDIYKSQSDGLLLDVPVPSTAGFTSVFQNIGALQTKGVELNLVTHNYTGQFNWNSQITFSSNQSLIKKLGPDDAPMILSRTSMNVINEIGEAPFSFFAYKYDGVYMNQFEIDADKLEYPFSVHPGDGRYVDVNGDGVINSDDRTIIGNGQPDFVWAITEASKINKKDMV